MKPDGIQSENSALDDSLDILEQTVRNEYKYGFVTDIEADAAPKGLNEDIIRFISAKKEEPEWMLEWRLKAYRQWQKMTEPHWANLSYPKIDYQTLYITLHQNKKSR